MATKVTAGLRLPVESRGNREKGPRVGDTDKEQLTKLNEMKQAEGQ